MRLRGSGHCAVRSDANRAQDVELAVPSGASDAKLGGVESRGRQSGVVGEGGGSESLINGAQAGPEA